MSPSPSASAKPVVVAVRAVPATGACGVIATEPLVGGVFATVTWSLTSMLFRPCGLVACTFTATLSP